MSTDTHYGSDDDTSPGATPDLLRPEVLNAFDRETFERDGYWVWEGVVTDAGCKQWTANLKKLQQMNDGILRDTDWAAIDFKGRGQSPPSARTDYASILGTMLRRIGTNATFSKV